MAYYRCSACETQAPPHECAEPDTCKCVRCRLAEHILRSRVAETVDHLQDIAFLPPFKDDKP